MSQLALIIDDEPDIRELLQITLQRMDINSHCAENLDTARSLLSQYQFDLCLTDMRLPDGDGVEFVNEFQSSYSHIPIAVISAHGSMDSAIQALKYGAFDFLTKPIDLNSLRSIIQSALNVKTKQVSKKPTIIGSSQAVQDLRKTIEKVARSQAPIYISGESGVGKELAAHMIHDLGPRADKPFVPINCGAIPDDLMESEFFGHIKGSFTGAVSDKQGLFQAADGGTLFLDEVADLPQHMQVKLLRAIQEKVVRPVGSQNESRVDVRILSATNYDLSERVNQGLFRQDLLYRINVIELKIPPLRKRPEDVPVLLEHILEKMAVESGFKKTTLSNEAAEQLKSYHFPGNVRELENILERAVTLCTDGVIEKEDILLPEKLNDDSREVALDSMLVDLEKRKIIEALEKTNGNKTKAAELLGISFRAFRYRLKKMDIK